MGKRYISIEKIKALAEKGLARTEIANRVGCCRQYISQVVDAYNIEIKKDLRLIKQPRINKCVVCKKKFVPKKYETSCSPECKKKRYTRIPRMFTADDVRKIRLYRRRGMSVKAIAREFGTASTNIYHILEGRSYSYIK